MTFDAFDRIFKVVEETPIEFEEIPKTTDPYHVWTIVDGDNGESYILPGYHFVNRFAYYTTERPWTNKDAEDLWVKW